MIFNKIVRPSRLTKAEKRELDTGVRASSVARMSSVLDEMAQESQDQRLEMAVNPPESEWISVTADMIAAGVERLEDLAAEILTERQYVVAEVYRAMELERRSRT